MVDKYKRGKSQEIFVNNLKGKLGEEVVKQRLGDLITTVNYEVYDGGDGGIDLCLARDANITIQVKARVGLYNQVKWYFKPEEIKLNKVLVCILIKEKVTEAENEYNLIFAGFLPTELIKLEAEGNYQVELGINELLYGGGLRDYLTRLSC